MNNHRMLHLIIFSVLLILNFFALSIMKGQADDVVIADFEKKDFGEWITTGEAFGDGPVLTDEKSNFGITGFGGKGYASSKPGGHAKEGSLTSPPFKIEREYINFQLGGGVEVKHIYVDLLVGGSPVKSAVPSVNDRLVWTAWEVAAMVGQTAQIQIVDDRSGHEEGYLFVDSIHQSHIPRAAPLATRTLEQDILSAFVLNPEPTKLPILGVWKKESQLLVSANFPEPPGFTCDAWCYEVGGIELIGAGTREGGMVEMEHRLARGKNKFRYLTEVIPTPQAIEFVVKAVSDPALKESLPDVLPIPNICFQLERAPRFKSGISGDENYPEFVSRCFIFTEKGRTFLLDGERNKIPCRPADDRENNPPWVQMYTGVWRRPPESTPSTWAAYSSTRYTVPIIGTVSRDRDYLVAIGEDSADGVCQAWHDCLHSMAKWQPVNAPPSEQVWRVKVYVMKNDPEALLERARLDFPKLEEQAKRRVPLKD